MNSLTLRETVSLTILPALGTLPPIALSYRPLYEGFRLALLYLVLLCLVVVSWRPVLFWRETEGKI